LPAEPFADDRTIRRKVSRAPWSTGRFRDIDAAAAIRAEIGEAREAAFGGVVVEPVLATTRRGLQLLIKQGRVAQVVVASVDCLTRRLFHLQQLLEAFSVNGVELGVVCDPHYGETAGNRLTANIVATASEFQQELTRERMAEARKALKSKGRRIAGRVPLGFDKQPETKQLVLNSHEADHVRTMFEMAAADKRPQEISDYATSQGWRTRSGLGKSGAWMARQTLRVLANPIYTGSIRNGVGTLPGIHEAIVTAKLFQQVREVIQSRRSRSPGREGRSGGTWSEPRLP